MRCVLTGLLSVAAACAGAGGTNSTVTSPGGGGGTTPTPPPPTATAGINDAKVKVLSSNLIFPFNVLVDATNVYWNDASTGAVGAAPISGTSSATFLVAAGTAAGIDIAQDATNIYYTLNNFTMRKVPKAGGASTLLISNASGNPSPSGLVVAGGKVIFGMYVSGNGASSNSGPGLSAIMSIGTNGGAFTNVATSNNGASTAWMLVATDGTNVYFGYNGSVTGNAIRSVPLSGGAAVNLLSEVGEMTAILAPATGAGAGSVFFAERASGATSETLRKLSGSTVTVLATIITQGSLSIAADESFIYYPKYDSQSGGSVIAKQSLSSGAVTILVGSSATNGVTAGVAVDASNVYWAAARPTGSSIRSAPKN
jgi:hypothetical protein